MEIMKLFRKRGKCKDSNKKKVMENMNLKKEKKDLPSKHFREFPRTFSR